MQEKALNDIKRACRQRMARNQPFKVFGNTQVPWPPE